MTTYHKMEACIDTVRGAWLTARAQAIEDGRPYRFAVSGSHFRIAPDDDDYWPTAPPSDPDHTGFVQEGTLPEGVEFQQVGSAPANDDTPHSSSDKTDSSSRNWDIRTVFLPDGTADRDDQYQFKLSGAVMRTIKLRSMTGTIEVKIEGEEDN
jgi:hypothetical protein